MDQLWRQVVGAIAVLAYSFVVTYVIAQVLDRIMGLRVADEFEHAGLDATVHAEQGYELGDMSVGS